MRKISFLLGCVLLCAGIVQAAEKPLIRIGARVFPEQTLLAEITSQYLIQLSPLVMDTQPASQCSLVRIGI